MNENEDQLLKFALASSKGFEDMGPNEIEELCQSYASYMANAPQHTFIEPEPDEFFDALSSPETTPQTIEDLIAKGANPNATRAAEYEKDQHALAVAVKTGNPDIVAILLKHGADATNTNENGYSIIVHACFGNEVQTNPGLVSILGQLIAHGADVNSQTSYGETPVRVLSRFNRYDAIGFLLEHGASTQSIQWNDLHKAVALGSVNEIEKLIEQGEDINAMDWQDRTPVMIALQIGDLEKVQCLVRHGANFDTTPTSKSSPLECAVQSRNPDVLSFYLDLGHEYVPSHLADHGPIRIAMDYGNEEMARITYEAYKDSPDIHRYLNEALDDDEQGEYARWLLAIGANSTKLEPSARRILIGHDKFDGDPLDGITKEQYRQDRSPRFGTANPEEVTSAYWLAMIHSRSNGYRARMKFSDEPTFACGPTEDPVWCADRFGQTFTYLPDGRVIEIAGEHEDSYDPDFRIYNDVFVHELDGNTRIFLYPRDVFPPTDFHSATLVEPWIYIIGSLGYQEDRPEDSIAVYRLNTVDFHIEHVETQNPPNFQLYDHDARLTGSELVLTGGRHFSRKDTEFTPQVNTHTITLNLDTLTWHVDS